MAVRLIQTIALIGLISKYCCPCKRFVLFNKTIITIISGNELLYPNVMFTLTGSTGVFTSERNSFFLRAFELSDSIQRRPVTLRRLHNVSVCSRSIKPAGRKQAGSPALHRHSNYKGIRVRTEKNRQTEELQALK